MSSRKLRVERIEHDPEIAADVVSVKFSRNLTLLEGIGLTAMLQDKLNKLLVVGNRR